MTIMGRETHTNTNQKLAAKPKLANRGWGVGGGGGGGGGRRDVGLKFAARCNH